MVNDEEKFENYILPLLYKFLKVDSEVSLKKLRETIKQADPNEDLSTVIENYQELEFCFRHSNVLHFVNRRTTAIFATIPVMAETNGHGPIQKLRSNNGDGTRLGQDTWSLLLPICSRGKAQQAKRKHAVNNTPDSSHQYDTNRFLELTLQSQHDPDSQLEDEVCWRMLRDFAASVRDTLSKSCLERTEVIVGIDVDDPVYQGETVRRRIEELMPCKVLFVTIQPELYGKVCRIWNFLARHATNDFVVLLGDDIVLKDKNWMQEIVQCFHDIASKTGLPFGAACVAMNDLCFPGFPTFPVVHRWHIDHFGTLLPKQFVNQGGDPYLYELYSRFNAAAFSLTSRLENTVGGDGDARYRKYNINWKGQILSMGLRSLRLKLDQDKPKGIVLDVVVPSYRTNNNEILERICKLRASVDAYVKFWIVVDNPLESHVQAVKDLQDRLNKRQLMISSNYFVNVIHYAENRGASYARNTGFNYSTADWVLFLDDDIIPGEHLLDAYIGCIWRYPDGKVFVGQTELPDACNLWTEMLRTCNVGYFYSIAQKMVHPPWGVTANLLVRGSRFNPTIQFKHLYPKTGGGEDIDFVYQYKFFYPMNGLRTTVGAPEAKVQHPWWNKGGTCYRQIAGWAVGDSLCITEWPEKTFLTFPNWIEHICFLVIPLSLYTKRPVAGALTALAVLSTEFLLKGMRYLHEAMRVCGKESPWWRTALVALGAGSVLSAQEATRTACLIRRGSLYSICRRVDWFDGQEPTIKLDIQLGSVFRFALNAGITWLGFFGVFWEQPRSHSQHHSVLVH